MSIPEQEFQRRALALGDWRGHAYGRLRRLVLEADPAIVEEVKWQKPSNPGGVLAYSHAGMVGTLETYKDKIKFTFSKGAALDDPAGLFNGPDRGRARRAVDVFEGDEPDAEDFKDLVRAAVALNGGP